MATVGRNPARRAPGPAARASAAGYVPFADRAAIGKSLRTETPRSGHAAWEPRPDRPDPIALLEEQAVERVPELVPIRYGRMSASPFAFYRARSLDIPLDPRRAARLLGTGEIARVDLGRITRAAGLTRYFAHAATVGLNVDFAKLATRASVRGRLGRLTYLVAAVYAVRERTTFSCTLEHDGVTDELELLQLSVISAPVVGGALGLTVRGPHPAEHRLDVLAVEDVPPLRMLRAGLILLLGIDRTVPGVRALQVERLAVDSPHPLGLSLDGELDGNLPGRFETVAGALRVIVPRRS